MSVIKNINSANVCTFGNKGVNTFSAVLDSLMKKDRKNTATYLVVPNNLLIFFYLSSLKNLMQRKVCLRLYFLRCKHLLN